MPKRKPGETLTDHQAKMLKWMGWQRDQNGSISKADEELSPQQIDAMLADATPVPISEEIVRRTLESIAAQEHWMEKYALLADIRSSKRRVFSDGIVLGVVLGTGIMWLIDWLTS